MTLLKIGNNLVAVKKTLTRYAALVKGYSGWYYQPAEKYGQAIACRLYRNWNSGSVKEGK